MKKNLFFAGLGLASSCFTVNAGLSDEKILDMEVMFISNEIDKETSRIVTVINVFPPRKHQNISE